MEQTSPHIDNSEHTYQIRVPEIVVAIIRELFVMLFCTYFVSMIIDALADSFVSNVFDTDLMLWALLAVGAVTVLVQPLTNASERRAASVRSRYVLAVAAGAVASAVVWSKTSSLGTQGMLYAVASGVIVATLSLIVLNEEHEDTDLLIKG